MFDIDVFIEQCQAAVQGPQAQAEIAELVKRAMAEPAAVVAALGEPQRAGVQKLFCTPELTVLNLAWGPEMVLMPHDHRMWAVIGIYGGREDNIFWRRIEGAEGGRLRAAGARALCTGDVECLGADAIHSVTNPITRLTGALHVYGGDFFATPRSEWDPETLLEGTYDVAKNLGLFEASNRRLAEASA
ncbi:MAG: hypothetical protein KDK91_30370 [Gammaproteobacteria bacterium]|nr:hypothetical protein [Gammaproteobacteria bacterium]